MGSGVYILMFVFECSFLLSSLIFSEKDIFGVIVIFGIGLMFSVRFVGL